MSPPKLSVDAWPEATLAQVGERKLLAFCGCDYLGLSHHPSVRAAIEAGLRRFGAGSNASRSTTGTTAAHERLEQQLAETLGLPAALLTLDGTVANVVACEGLAMDHDSALIDEHAHVSLRMAARSAGLNVHSYAHASASSVAMHLVTHDATHGAIHGAGLVMTDAVFGARGTRAPLRALLDVLPLANDHARLLIDDCHGLGVIGPSGRGSFAAMGAADTRVIVTASLAKAIGCAGGVVAGEAEFVARLREESATQRGCTPLPSAMALGACAALTVLEQEPERLQALRDNVAWAQDSCARLGVSPPADEVPVFTITPRDAQHAGRMCRALDEADLLVPLLEYPGGPAASYFRVALNAEHTEADLERLERTLTPLLAGVEPSDAAGE